MRRAYVFRAYPTRPQEGRAGRLLRDHCDLYNAALEERREAWRMRKESVSYGMQSAQLRDIRKADPAGQGMHSFTAQQQTLRRLSDAFAAFFERAGNAEGNGGKKPGYPLEEVLGHLRAEDAEFRNWFEPINTVAHGSASARHWPSSSADTRGTVCIPAA